MRRICKAEAALQYSKYIQAAIDAGSEPARQAVAARDDAKDAPNPFERAVHSDGYACVSTFEELRAALEEKAYSADLRARAGIAAAHLWQAVSMEGPSDATDAALCRVDAKAERQGRYRAATFLRSRLREKGPRRECAVYLEPSLVARIENLAECRGEEDHETLVAIIEAGFALMTERAKRYETGIILQLMAAGRAGLVLEAERYLDEHSRTLERAYEDAAPLAGAPQSVADLVSRFPRAS